MIEVEREKPLREKQEEERSTGATAGVRRAAQQRHAPEPRRVPRMVGKLACGFGPVMPDVMPLPNMEINISVSNTDAGRSGGELYC